MSEDQPTVVNVTNLPTASPAIEARDQAGEYGSVFASTTLRLDDGTEIEIPPHPNLRMFDDEAQAEYEELEMRLETFDRHPEQNVPEQNVYDAKGNLLMTLPPSTQPGNYKVPYRKTDPNTGEVVDKLEAPYQVVVAKIALGEQQYAKLRGGTINGRPGAARDVWQIWNEQGQAAAERQKRDSKSVGSTVDGAPVPPADTP